MGICTMHLPRTQMGPTTVIIGETNQRATVSFSRRKVVTWTAKQQPTGDYSGLSSTRRRITG